MTNNLINYWKWWTYDLYMQNDMGNPSTIFQIFYSIELQIQMNFR